MKIRSRLMTGLISKVINDKIKKKIGYEVDIQLNELNASLTNETAHVHLNVDAEMGKDELKNFLGRLVYRLEQDDCKACAKDYVPLKNGYP